MSGLSEKLRYLLTIENFASLNRHVIEADPEGEGLTIYVGGYRPRADRGPPPAEKRRELGNILARDISAKRRGKVVGEGGNSIRRLRRNLPWP